MGGLDFLRSNLQRLDPLLVTPLYGVTWMDFINIQPIELVENSVSYIDVAHAAGSAGAVAGIPYIDTATNTLQGVSMSGDMKVSPMRMCGSVLSWLTVDMERAQRLGVNLNSEQFNILNNQYQLSIDKAVFTGDTARGYAGLVNSADVAAANATNGTWSSATADQIIEDISETLQSAWSASGNMIAPDTLLLPPTKFAKILSTKSGGNSDKSIYNHVIDNSISTSYNNSPLKIKACRYLTGAGAGDTDRMMAYTNNYDFLNYPLTSIQRLKEYDQGINYCAAYVWALGEVQWRRPYTAIYRDNI